MVERKLRPAPSQLISLASRKAAPTAGKSGGRTAPNAASKLFVLDTNVLMHDPTSLFRFEEHDIYLPILTLEELDNNKKGMTEVARNARRRRASSTSSSSPGAGTERSPTASARAKSNGAATGRLFLQTETITHALPPSLANGKADNQILAVVMHSAANASAAAA
jgi:PhoH-like ATPase